MHMGNSHAHVMYMSAERTLVSHVTDRALEVCYEQKSFPAFSASQTKGQAWGVSVKKWTRDFAVVGK